LTVLRGDVLEPRSVERAVKGADAVLSAIGPRSRKAGPVCAPGVAAMVAAMTKEGVRRFVGISAAPVQPYDPADRLLYRLTAKKLLRWVLREGYADMARMEDELRRSTLDWTVVRPPYLSDKPARGHYRTALGRNIPGGYVISRADLAAEMLRCLDDPATIRTTVGIAY
jgi:putative NADH-flavin reductase